MSGGQPNRRYKEDLRNKREAQDLETAMYSQTEEVVTEMRAKRFKEGWVRLKRRVRQEEEKINAQVVTEKKRKDKGQQEKRCDVKSKSQGYRS